MPSDERDACRPHDLPGPDQPLRVAFIQACSGLGIVLGETPAELGAAQRAMQRHRLVADCGWDVGHLGEPREQRAQVEPGAADDDRHPAGFARGGDLGLGEAPPPRDRAALGRVEHAVKPVRRGSFGGQVGPCGQDAQIAIDLQRVGVDDRAAIGRRQFEREAGFAARRRAGDDDKGDFGLRLVMTLIAGAGGAEALSGIAAAIAGAIGAAGPDWLAPGAACDLVFDGDAASADKAARTRIGPAPIDCLVQPLAGRRKQVLVADMESTVIENEMLDELADFVGLRAQVAEITRRAMNGELDFTAALAERVALLKGLPVSVLDEAYGRVRVIPGAAALVATMRAAGADTALVSGGFGVFAERVAARLGFGRVVCNHLDLAGGHIAGTVAAPLVTAETKRQTLLDIAAARGISLAETLAVGDGANDLPMLLAAGLGIAFRAKPSVAAAARWRVEHADLTALLYGQGYRHDQIVTPR